jgi:hypothetical protein
LSWERFVSASLAWPLSIAAGLSLAKPDGTANCSGDGAFSAAVGVDGSRS